MGKKNKKSRRYDDGDLFGPPPAVPQEDEQLLPDGDADQTDTAAASDVATAAADTDDEAAKNPPKKKISAGGIGGATAKKKAFDIDQVRLEETMTEILRACGGDSKSDDWLIRTVEKNMRLPKHSLKAHLDTSIWEDTMARANQKLDREYDEEVERKETWDRLVAGMCKKSELSRGDEEKLIAQAQAMGIDAENAVAVVMESIRNAGSTQEQNDAIVEDRGHDAGRKQNTADLDGLNSDNASLSVSILLTLKPYLEQSSPAQSPSFAKAFLAIRQSLCTLLYTVLSLLLGHQAKSDANQIYERIHLPSIKAAQLSREREEDERMLGNDNHLWSEQQLCWIEKNETYSPPPRSAGAPIPPTIRWNDARKQWERWSKNLKTRTKATKQAEAAGMSAAFSKGTFVHVRAGEGWASAPDQPEVEKEQVVIGGIRFFACLPAAVEISDGKQLEVVDVTNWATKTLLTKEAARELEAVDSGRGLFSLDLPMFSADKKGGGEKGKGKNPKKKIKRNDEVAVGEDQEANSVARKGVGCTARVSDRYLDRL